MFLKRVEIFGFKSFLKGFKFELGPGIMSIVGPNGCGKSNISESIRWVLGEQNARLLRGETMEDVIFNGTRSRKPVGMAEVSLTIANDERRLPIDYSEVTITRRVFRSGVSEYLLNKSPVRLKDIRDLFTDTGMSNFSYSLIERAMVDTLINDTSTNLRILLEEAAGIVKYKAQERLALKKLEATEKDLTRIRDIVSEVEKRVRSLKRQESRARRFKTLTDRVRELTVRVAREERDAFRNEEGVQSGSFRAAQDALERTSAELAGLEARLEEARAHGTDGEKTLAAAQAEVEEVAQRLRDLSRERMLLDEREKNANDRIREANATVEEARARLVAAVEEKTLKGAEIVGVRREIDDADVTWAERKRRLAEIEPELAGLRADVKSRKQLTLDIVRSGSDRREGLAALEARLGEFDARAERVRAEEAGIAAERARLAPERARLAGECSAAERNVARLESAHAEAGAALEARTAEREEIVGRHSLLEGRRESVEGNLALLRDLERNYEGFRKGARTILLEAGAGRHRGVMGDLIRLRDEGLRSAVAAALGGGFEALVVGGERQTGDLLDFLRDGDRGRATFLLLERFRPGNVVEPDHAVLRERGVRGVARDAVESDGAFSAILDFLLGRVIVVEDRAAALRLSARAEYAELRFVTRDGEVAHHPGIVTGGSHADERSGFLERKGEIVERERERERLLAEIAAARAARERLDGEIEAARARVAECAAALRGGLERAAARRRDEEAVAATLAALAERGSALAAETAEVARGRELLGREVVALRSDAARAGAEEEAVGTSLGEMEARLHALEVEREAAARLSAESEVAHARLSTRLEALDADIARCAALERELTERIVGKTDEALALAERVAEMERELARLGESEVFEVREREKREEKRDAFINANQETYERIADLDRRVKQARKAKDEARERFHALDLSLGELRGKIASLEERIREEHGRALDELIAELPDRTTQPAAASAAAEEDEDKEEGIAESVIAAIAASGTGAGAPPSALRVELIEARKRLERVGPVNLVALQEFEEENERYTFLKDQESDLVTARDSLNETIRTVDAKARTLFLDTYEAVREHFKRTFTTLFQGGEADIVLQDPTNPLETEIEIVARPGGKRLQRVALMSGGERALTAIAILFAVYLHKPSPFCILDEVDAPLDEANVGRFVSLLRAFSERTQFLVITHNKRTMEAADTLFGVTMEEPGVSKLVSVRLSEIGDRFPVETAEGATKE